MAYYTRDNLPSGSVLGPRRPTINEFFLSSYTLSIYEGCEIGCPYCDGWAYTPRALNERVNIPFDLVERLEVELADVDRGDLIAISTLSDPYQPAEQSYHTTRQVLQLLAAKGQPCLVLTKGVGIKEDFSLLQKINEQSLAIVMTTLLTVDRYLAEKIEGKAYPPALRLEMLAAAKKAGLPIGVALVPIIPYVNDTDYSMSSLLRACIEIGVDFFVWDFLHIPNVRHRFRINQILASIGSYPPSYYRDIYHEQPLPSVEYRAERSTELLRRCDNLNLASRVPHRVFAGKLRPANEAAILLKHAAFRDVTHGRVHLANMHRELADLIYRGEPIPAKLRTTPLWPQMETILGELPLPTGDI